RPGALRLPPARVRVVPLQHEVRPVREVLDPHNDSFLWHGWSFRVECPRVGPCGRAGVVSTARPVPFSRLPVPRLRRLHSPPVVRPPTGRLAILAVAAVGGELCPAEGARVTASRYSLAVKRYSRYG